MYEQRYLYIYIYIREPKHETVSKNISPIISISGRLGAEAKADQEMTRRGPWKSGKSGTMGGKKTV
jgi:hypothetical protein